MVDTNDIHGLHFFFFHQSQSTNLAIMKFVSLCVDEIFQTLFQRTTNIFETRASGVILVPHKILQLFPQLS